MFKLIHIHQAHIRLSVDALPSHGEGDLRPLANNSIFIIIVQDAQDEGSKITYAGFRRLRILYEPHILKEQTINFGQRPVWLVQVVENRFRHHRWGELKGVNELSIASIDDSDVESEKLVIRPITA